MPFVSEAQRAWMHANHPKMAERWEHHTKRKKLPSRVHNARRVNRIDPTRTLLMRKKMVAYLRRKFARLKAAVYQLIVRDDALGLRDDAVDHYALHPSLNCNPGQLRDAATGKCGPQISQGIARSSMPQVSPHDQLELQEWLREQGIGSYREIVAPQYLKPIQKEYSSKAVQRMHVTDLQHPIIISSDFRIIDGTHRWLRALQEKVVVPVLVVMVDSSEALETIERFPKATRRPLLNESFAHETDPQKVKSFRRWIKKQIGENITGVTNEVLWTKYVNDGFVKGLARAHDDVRKPSASAERADFLSGAKQEAVRTATTKPASVESAQLLASRSFTELEGVTDQMEKVMVRTLTDGLVQGKTAKEIARELSDDIDSIGFNRARLIAQTELVRAHAEGQLTMMEHLGVTHVNPLVEWETANDDAVCAECAAMEGDVFTLEEARGLIPQHPGCRCAWAPADDEDFDGDAVENAFCPTGHGGGIDPTCGKGGDVHTLSKKLAKQKIRNAPVPSQEAVAKAREELERAKRGEGRAGGENRGGGSADRRRQRENLFKEFGGEEHGYIACPHCGRHVHKDADNELGLPRFERGKIFTKAQGGGYQLPNLLPECFDCNRSRNDKPIRKENL